MQHNEDKIQINIVAQHAIYFPHVIITHPANQGRSPQEGAKLKKMGVRAGASDLLLWWDYGAGGIEIKDEDKKETPNQITFGFLLKRMGHYYGVAHSWEEYYHLLISFGIKPQQECRFFKEANTQTWEDKLAAVHNLYKRPES